MIHDSCSVSSGFVILFAVLVSTIVLAMALGIFSIAYKETILTATAKDSDYSFFAADTGAECALYADVKDDAFGATGGTPTCDGAPVSNLSGSGSFFTFDISLVKGCVKVSVNKASDPSNTPPLSQHYTSITSLGYNLSCAAVSAAQLSPNLRLVERKLEVIYPNPAPVAPPPPSGGA